MAENHYVPALSYDGLETLNRMAFFTMPYEFDNLMQKVICNYDWDREILDEIALYLENGYEINESIDETEYTHDKVIKYLCRMVYLFMDEIY